MYGNMEEGWEDEYEGDDNEASGEGDASVGNDEVVPKVAALHCSTRMIMRRRTSFNWRGKSWTTRRPSRSKRGRDTTCPIRTRSIVEIKGRDVDRRVEGNVR